MSRCVSLDIDGRLVEEQYNDLDAIYACIGRGCSSFQCLPGCTLSDGRSVPDIFCDEEGKMNGQPVNIFATDLMRQAGMICESDWICGKIMFVGPPDWNGITLDVRDDVLPSLRRFMQQYDQFI